MTSTQGLFMAIPKIFVISLKNSTRRENIAKRLSGLRLDFTFLFNRWKEIACFRIRIPRL